MEWGRWSGVGGVGCRRDDGVVGVVRGMVVWRVCGGRGGTR